MFHKWPGTHGPQVNWALDNVGIKAKWVMRLDADEYLTPETIVELKETLERLERDPGAKDVTLISMPLIQVPSGRQGRILRGLRAAKGACITVCRRISGRWCIFATGIS